MIRHHLDRCMSKAHMPVVLVLLSTLGMLLVCLGAFRAAVLTNVGIKEEEAACARMLEADVIDRRAVAALIRDFPSHDTSSPVGYILLQRHFFTPRVFTLIANQALICAGIAAGAAVLNLTVVLCLVKRK